MCDTMFRSSGGWLVAACTITVIAMTNVISNAAATDDALRKGLTIVAQEQHDDGDAGQHSLEIRVENGKVSVKRDGREVPDAQIHAKNGKIIVLDEKGNELKALDLHLGDGGQGYKFEVGDALVEKFGEPAEPPKVMIGIHMDVPGPALERHLGLERGATTLITGLYEGLPAHAAGLEEFDIITEVGGKSPADSASVREAIAAKDPGETIELTVIHRGKPKRVTITVAAHDAEKMQQANLIGTEAGQPGLMREGFPWAGEFNVNLDNLHKQFFVDPEGKHLLELAPRMREHARQRQEGANGGGDRGGERLNSRLDQLDQRMADLEAMLRKLVEQQSGR